MYGQILDTVLKDGLYLKEALEESCVWKAWMLFISNAA